MIPNNTLIQGHYTPNKSSSDTNELWGLAVFSDGKKLVSCADDDTLRIWDVEEKKMEKIIDMRIGTSNENWVTDASRGRTVDIISNSKLCAVGFKDGSFRIWET